MVYIYYYTSQIHVISDDFFNIIQEAGNFSATEGLVGLDQEKDMSIKSMEANSVSLKCKIYHRNYKTKIIIFSNLTTARSKYVRC